MTRENKLALVVGFGLILFVGILISDHFSVARTQVSADLSGVQDPLTNQVALQDIVDLGVVPEPVLPAPLRPPVNQGGLQPGELAVGTAVIPMNPADYQPLLEPAPLDRVAMAGSNADAEVAPITEQVREETAVPEGFQAIPRETEVAMADVRFHEVRGGESMFGICRQYFGDPTLVTALATFNKMNDPASLRSGQRLMIPTAEQLGAKPRQVAKANTRDPAGVKPSGLRVVNEKTTPADLVTKTVAKPAAAKGKTHTVRRGESLSHIAQRVYGNKNKWKKILELNKHQINDPDDVKIGMVLRLS